MQDTTIREIEQFLYREARMLDDRQYHAWLDLFTDDVRYWMPVRTSRYAKISKSVVLLDEAGYDETDVAKDNEQAIMDEDKASLTLRVARLDTGMAWAEDPPSLTRHFLSNIEVEAGDTPSEYRVYCNIMVYRSRGRSPSRFLCRATPRPSPSRLQWATQNRPPENRSRSECPPSQKREHVFLSTQISILAQNFLNGSGNETFVTVLRSSSTSASV